MAEAQIAAEVALLEEQQREKNKQLARDLERKTNLLFQKKNLRGQTSTPQVFAPAPQTQSSQMLVKLQVSKQAKLGSNLSKPKKALSSNRSGKSSFISQQVLKV